MNFGQVIGQLSTWWRCLPKKTRVRLLVCVLVVFVGSEFIVLAPEIFEIAVLIDALGLAFAVTMVSASIQLSLLQLTQFSTTVISRLNRVARTLAWAISSSTRDPISGATYRLFLLRMGDPATRLACLVVLFSLRAALPLWVAVSKMAA